MDNMDTNRRRRRLGQEAMPVTQLSPSSPSSTASSTDALSHSVEVGVDMSLAHGGEAVAA